MSPAATYPTPKKGGKGRKHKTKDQLPPIGSQRRQRLPIEVLEAGTPFSFAKFTAGKRDRYLAWLRLGRNKMQAARKVDLSRFLIREYCKQDEAFAEEEELALEEGKLANNEDVVGSLLQQTRRGNMVAILSWLYNKLPEEWRDRRSIKVTGDEREVEDAITRRLAAMATGRQEAVPGTAGGHGKGGAGQGAGASRNGVEG